MSGWLSSMLHITFQTVELCVWQHLAFLFAEPFTDPAALLLGKEGGITLMEVQFLLLLVEQHSSPVEVVRGT